MPFRQILFILLTPLLALAEPWQRLTDAEAQALGWSRERLAAARDYTRTIPTEAVMIVAGGKVLDSWGAVEAKLNVHSIRKSFISALCGIQVDARRLRLEATMAELGIDDNEPRLTETEKRATVHDLLKARSGVYHSALYETARMKEKRPPRHSHAPGTFWYYNNWDFNALGTIYEQECGAGVYDDFQRLIAAPLGMEDFSPADCAYVTGADSIHRAYPFRMTARDMARFGLLFLRGGLWQGRQVVPAEWVKASVTSYSNAGTSGGYGYLWWIGQSGVHLPGVTLPEGSYSARGAGGHYILNVPALDLVIVHRVNTDIEGRRVESAQFGQLVRLILEAFTAPGAISDEKRLALLMSKHRVPGASLLTIQNGQVEKQICLGLREAGKGDPVTPATVFEAASMTKPLAAYAAMKLVEQQKLDLDRPLALYLPQPYLKDQPLHEKITARMVLNHTTGFPNWRPKGGALQVKHEPGTTHTYSGEGLQFLQTVIERLTGEGYESFMRRTLLDPLGMKSSSHVWSDALATHAAAGHDAQGSVKAQRRHYTRPNAAYSLYCTPRDYAAFVLEMMNPRRDAAHSLSADSIRQMLTPAGPPTKSPLLVRRGSQVEGSIRFGLGWSIEPTASGPRIRHSGSNGTGFRSYVEFDPIRQDGLIIMTNADSGAALWRDLVQAIGRP